MFLLLYPRQILFMLLFLPTAALADAMVMANAACTTSPIAPKDALATTSPDYVAINEVLTSSDRQLRLARLPVLMHELESQNNAEAAAAGDHLRLALAQSQALDGQFDNAAKTLKALPLQSSLTPEALNLLAEIELLRKRPDAAMQWLQQLASLFPDEPLSVQGLLRAATINSGNSLALLHEGVRRADKHLAEARYWEERSHQVDFLDEADTRQLPASLWRLAKTTLTDPAFALADSKQARARQQMQCLLSRQSAHTELLDKNPMLLADLANTVAALDIQLGVAKTGLGAREKAFLAAASDWKACRSKGDACQTLKDRSDDAGRELTAWRNRITVLEKKIDFLRQEKTTLPSRWQQDSRDIQALADRLADDRSDARQTMMALLQISIQDSLAKREELAAQAHYQLALAQDPRLARKRAN